MEEKIIKFEDMQLSKKVLNAVRDMGFEEPSPIQAQTIPLALEGHDVIGQAQTGTGKTAAFGIPTIVVAGLHRVDFEIFSFPVCLSGVGAGVNCDP